MKIVCPYCEKINEVTKNSTNIKCESCGQFFTVEDGKKKTIEKYKSLVNEAYNYLYQVQEYQKAYDSYEEALNIKPNDISSIVGLCLAKVSMGTFDVPYFNEVIDIINSFDIYLNLENTVIFLSFANDILDHIEFYLHEVDDRLMVNDTFINENYFTHYINGLKDIKKLLNFIKDAESLMKEEDFNGYIEDNPRFKEKFDKVTEIINKRLNTTYNVNEIGDIKVVDGVLEIKKENIIKLDEIPEVNNLIVPINEKGKKYQKIFMPLIIGLGLIGLVLLLIYGGVKNLGLLISGIVILISAFLSYGLFRLLVARSLKK